MREGGLTHLDEQRKGCSGGCVAEVLFVGGGKQGREEGEREGGRERHTNKCGLPF